MKNTKNSIPEELLPYHTKLQSLSAPVEPFKRDSVAETETALEGVTFSELAFSSILIALLPWWADVFVDGGGSGDEGVQDYFAASAVAGLGTAWFSLANTDNGFWLSFTLGWIGAIAGLFLMFIFHLITHKCITMFVYNRVFRPGWVRKMRAKDIAQYQSDVDSYDERVATYRSSLLSASGEAQVALDGYHAGNPRKRFTLTDKGFVHDDHSFDDVVKDFTLGAKNLFGRLARR